MLRFLTQLFPQLISTTLSLLMLLSAMAEPASGSDAQADTSEIRLQLRWLHQFQFAGYYAAIEQGYYKKAGLNVTLIEGGGGKNTIEEVLSGKANYGVTNSEVLLHRLNGQPLVAVAAIFQRSPLVFLTRKDTGISVPQDFHNKIVKMSRSSRDIELQAMLQGEGIDYDKYILLGEVATYDDYFDPNIDVLAAYITNQPYYLKEKGIAYTIISPTSYGVDFYGDCLFTTEDVAKNHPEQVKAFREATLDGWHYALEHKDEIIDLIQKKYQSTKSRAHLQYEAAEIEKLILADLVAIGHMNPGRWLHIARIFQQFDLISTPYTLDGFLFTPDTDRLPDWVYRLVLFLAVVTLVFSIGFITLALFNRRLQKEISIRKATENELQESKKALHIYSRQIEQFSLSAASILSIRNEKLLFAEMSKAITDLSDFRRVLILLFKDESPYRELIASAGIPEETLVKIRMTHLPKSWYDDIFSLGIKLGQMSYYVPHTMKSILNQESIFYGEGPLPDKEGMWHPADNLFVRMNNERGELVGVISVDTSKSLAKPTDETVRPLEVYAALISQIIVLKREFQRRQQLEQRLRFSQKLEALGNLTGGIAHDFNNILGIIIGNSELALLDTPKTAPAYHNIVEIRNACSRARDIVQHLLMFNKKTDKDLRPVSVNDLLLDSLKFLSTTIPPSIELIKRIETVDELILADPPQFYQALLNLVTNAVQAMEEQGGRLTITSRAEVRNTLLKCSTGELGPGRYVRLQLIDTGHGIEADLVDRIFDPYYTTREFGKGTGMGLSIVHGIVQSHNGCILVNSEPDHGTTFTIYLPLVEKEEKPVLESSILPQGSETILLVDDDIALLEVGSRMLEKLGYRVIAVDNPYQAIDLLEESLEHIDLLITDMTMPGMDGKELTVKALQIQPALPIFLCTGYSEKIDREEASQLGIRRYFDKPVDPSVLANAIRETFDDLHSPVP